MSWIAHQLRRKAPRTELLKDMVCFPVPDFSEIPPRRGNVSSRQICLLQEATHRGTHENAVSIRCIDPPYSIRFHIRSPALAEELIGHEIESRLILVDRAESKCKVLEWILPVLWAYERQIAGSKDLDDSPRWEHSVNAAVRI